MLEIARSPAIFCALPSAWSRTWSWRDYSAAKWSTAKSPIDATQSTTVDDVYCAGEPTGIGGVDLSIVEGQIAGLSAARQSVPSGLVSRAATLRREASAMNAAFALRSELRTLAQPDTIVCRCEDVRLRDLNPRWSARQAKLYARAGMGPCQGRICGAALEVVMDWRADSVRPPSNQRGLPRS
jgi:hypothetical protein